MQPPPCFFASLPETSLESFGRSLVREHIRTVVATVDNVVTSSFKLDAQLSRHRSSLTANLNRQFINFT